MQNQLILNALELMLAGMGVVFLFLLVLTTFTYFLGWVSPHRESDNAEIRKKPDNKSDGQLVAAISAAVTRYRQNNRS